jgi:uncharacterized membrane protein YbhN (UPF0104 family)
VFNWLFWIIGYYLLIKSLTLDFIPFEISFSFPLATTLGILAIIFPGGIGVRESILIFALSTSNIETSTALGLAINARFWFLIGEIALFITAFAIKFKAGNHREG